MGRRKPRKGGPKNICIYRTAMKTESSISSSAECGTENVDYSLRDPSWDMSHGNCTCDQNICLLNSLKVPERDDESDQNICLLNSLKVPERDDESTNVGGDVSGKPVQAVHPLPVRRTRAAQHLRNPPPPLQDLPSPDHPHPGASTGEDPCRYLDSPAGPVKRRSQSKRGYNLRHRKCTCMGLEEASCQSGTGTEAAPKLVVMAESSSTLTEQSVSVIKTVEETLGIKMEKNEDIPGVDSCSVDVKKSVAADQAPLAFVKENCPSMHMSQAEFLKDCGLVKAHSAVFVKQEVVPMELDLECQIVSVEHPLPVLPRLSPNTRSLISSIKRETSDSPKAKRSLNCGLGVCNGGDSDNSSDSGMVEDSGKRSSIRGSLLCIALSSPLGQRVKKFTKADLVKPSVSDIERYCISIPEEDELRLRLRQKDQYPVRFKRRKNMVIDYSYTYKFNLAKRQWRVWRVCSPQEFNPICQAERYQIKKCLVRLSRLDEKQVRLKTVRKKTILNREVTIDNDLSIVQMDVPEQLYDEIQKMHMTESSSPEQPGPQPVPDSDSVRPVPSPSGIAGSSSSTGIRKGLPKHLRPCPMSKRKHQLTQEDSVEEIDVESVLLSSEEDEPVEKQRVNDDKPQMESEDVQIISVTNISSPSIVIDLSDTEEQEGCTGSRITTSSDGAVPSTVVNESTSLPKESPVCGAAGVHNRVEESQVTATVSVATRQNSASVDAMCTFTVSTASADSRDSSAHLSPTVSQSVNANSASTPSSAVQASQTTGPTSDRGLPSDGQRPGLSAQTQPVPGALTMPSGAQDMNVTSVSQISSGDSVASGSQHSTCLTSTPGSTTAQAQAGLKQNPGMQNVHEPQRPDAVHNLVDGTQPIVVTAPNLTAIPGSNTVPSWPVTPMMSPAQCVSVMSYPSSVQNVPMPMMSPNPPTALTLQAGVTQGQIMASRSDDPTSEHNLPPVLCSPTVQNSMFTADSFSTDSTPVLPNLPPLVNAASLPVVPASPTLAHSTLNMPPTQNADTASNTAILQTNNPSAQNMPCVSSPSNIQTVAAVSSVQFAPLVPHSTSPQNTLQGPHTPLSPVEAPGTMQNTLGIAQPISVPSTPPLMGGAPPPQQVTQIPSRSVLMSPSQGMFPPTDMIPAQSVGQISHMQNTAAGNARMSVPQNSPYVQGNARMSVPQNSPHIQNNAQMSSQNNPFFVPGNVQTSVPQSSPYAQGNPQVSLPQAFLHAQGNMQKPVPQNSSCVQGNLQSEVPQMFPNVQQGSVQMSQPQHSSVQGSVQTSSLQQSPYVQGSSQTNPQQPTPQAQMNSQTAGPQNFPCAQGNIQMPTSHNTLTAQDTVQSSVPQVPGLAQGSIQTSVSPNSGYVQGSVPSNVSAISYNVQGGVQTSVAQNIFPKQGFPTASSNGQGQELAVPAPSSMPAQPQGSSGTAQSSQRVAQMCGHSETATRGGGGFPPAAQSQGSAGMMSVLQGNQSTSHQTAPGGETANQGTALSAQASPFQSTAQSQPAFVGGNVNPTNPPTPSHLPSNQNQSSAVLGNAPQGQNNPPVSVSNTQLNTSHVQNNPDSISNPQVNASHLQNNPVSISNIQNTPNLQSNPINISNAPMNAPPVQNNPAGSISSTESSSLVQITTNSAACGLGIQSSAPIQSVAPLQSSTGAQNVSANATGQPGQTGCVGQGTEPSVILIDEESPEVLKQKLSVFNLIPNRTPSASPSKQMPATAMESTQNVPSAAATTTEDSSQLRISAVYGAAELASMFELASSSLSVSTPSTQPVERPTETQQAVGTVTEESWPQIQIGAVYGAAELANTNIAASLGLERPRAPYANIRGSSVAPPRFQAPYNTGYNAGYRTRQPRYDYRMQQSYVNTNRQRFTRPPQTYAAPPRPQRHVSVPRQQNYYRGRGAPYGGGGNPVRFGRGASRAPVNPQFVPEAVYEDDDCVEVICLDDD
ncbi:hypothetical protein ACOMHN_051681 [Nucella lapillus]